MSVVNMCGEFEQRDETRFLKLKDGDDWRVRVIERMVREGKLKLCDVCGKPFEPKNSRQLRCSFKCKQEANRYNTRRRNRLKKAAEREKRDRERRQEDELISIIAKFTEGQ